MKKGEETGFFALFGGADFVYSVLILKSGPSAGLM